MPIVLKLICQLMARTSLCMGVLMLMLIITTNSTMELSL